MSLWLVLCVPATLLVMTGILFLSAVVERRFLSPRSLIMGAVKTKRNTPEYAEAFVARQLEELLRDKEL